MEADEPQSAGLSRIETLIISEIARGASNKEIALKLFVYEDVVKGHLRAILWKLGARDQAQAMALWKTKDRSPFLPDI